MSKFLESVAASTVCCQQQQISSRSYDENGIFPYNYVGIRLTSPVFDTVLYCINPSHLQCYALLDDE